MKNCDLTPQKFFFTSNFNFTQIYTKKNGSCLPKSLFLLGGEKEIWGGMRIFLFAYLVRKPVSYEKDGG
jgi:hypothetical protein